MSERRRHLFVLLLVAGFAIASIAVLLTKSTRLGLDLRGGVEITLQARPSVGQTTIDPETLDRTIEIMRDRVDPQGVLEPEIQRSGADQITVAIPGFQDPAQARRLVGRTAQLFFYDWEVNVLGPDGQPAPEDGEVTGAGTTDGAGGPAAAMPLYEAVQLAAKQQRRENRNRAHADTFYLVDEQGKKVISGPETVEEDLFDSTDEAAAERQREQYEVVRVPSGTTILQAEAPRVRSGADPQGAPKRQDRWYVLRDEVSLYGTDIKDPVQSFDELNAPAVSFDFTSEGRKKWEEVTRTIAQRGLEQSIGGTGPQHFAIALDNQLISVPQINPQEFPDGISGSNGSQISGGFTIESAQELAGLLRTGALPVDLRVISETQISASLGQEALDEGIVAGAAGFAVVALFLIAFYRLLGVLAVMGLGLYATFLFALVKLIPITMTLPGIAGLILTIGVAADANIVIFERIKEELRAGRGVKAAIQHGYRKGLTAIIDANVVTFTVAFILYVLATAGVKGFAFMLGVGTLVSFLTAVIFTQAILGVVGNARAMQGRAAFGGNVKQKGPRRFDFMGRSKIFFSLSGVILLIGAFGIGSQGVPLGIDFESGTRITTGTERPATEDGVREVMSEAGYADAKIQKIETAENDDSASSFQITTETLEGERFDAVQQALDEAYGVEDRLSATTVGPTFGQQIANTAIIAIIASLFVISAYIAIRFEWKYAVPVLIAITHDILIVAGVYALLGAEVTSSTVAALLTILGYSLYDTIIVFDRIRENVPRMPKATYSQIVNQSMSEVLVRSLVTSFSTLLPTLALYWFGGETLQDFALALIIGTLSGVYSSIFIAGPVLVHWKEREPQWRRRHKSVAAAHGGLVPAYADSPKLSVEEPKREGPVRLSPNEAEPISQEEFDALVRDLGVEGAERAAAGTQNRAERRAAEREQASAPVEQVDPNDPVAQRRAEARRRREQRQSRGTEGER